jgi:hypothetical protein
MPATALSQSIAEVLRNLLAVVVSYDAHRSAEQTQIGTADARTSPVCSRTICRPALPAMRFRAEVEGFAERKCRLGACRDIEGRPLASPAHRPRATESHRGLCRRSERGGFEDRRVPAPGPPVARYRGPPRVVSASRARGLRGPLRSVDPPTYCALPRAAAVVSASRARGLRGPPRPGGRSTCRALSRGATAAPGSPERRGVWGALRGPPSQWRATAPSARSGGFRGSPRPVGPPNRRALSRGATAAPGSPERWGAWGGPFRGPPFQTDARCE